MKLKKLQEYTEILSAVATYSTSDFIENPIIYGGAERFILLGYQCILETCKLVCEYLDCRENFDDVELIKKLESNRVFPAWLGVNLNQRIKYIYTLHYDYLRCMSKSELYTLLDEIVGDFRSFNKYVLEYI